VPVGHDRFARRTTAVADARSPRGGGRRCPLRPATRRTGLPGRSLEPNRRDACGDPRACWCRCMPRLFRAACRPSRARARHSLATREWRGCTPPPRRRGFDEVPLLLQQPARRRNYAASVSPCRMATRHTSSKEGGGNPTSRSIALKKAPAPAPEVRTRNRATSLQIRKLCTAPPGASRKSPAFARRVSAEITTSTSPSSRKYASSHGWL
jgi:hypothetical protein